MFLFLHKFVEGMLTPQNEVLANAEMHSHNLLLSSLVNLRDMGNFGDQSVIFLYTRWLESIHASPLPLMPPDETLELHPTHKYTPPFSSCYYQTFVA